jgi:glycerophosphoryl diester phosphodiesterase|tara:strand:- start:204 stop:1061 length:858 start_codon:yes stop_codon:yes gene_type:complete
MSIWNDLSWVEGIRTPALSVFFENISLAGYPTFLILFISFGYFFWSPSRFSRIAMMLFISGLINGFLKDFFQDPRPLIELMLDPKVGTSYGWPSGHAQIAVTLWGLIAYELKDKRATIGAGILIFLIAFSRMYLGVHDLGDVISGLIIGTIILAIWHLAVIYKIYESLSKKSWMMVIGLFQIIIYYFYPVHEGHEANVWFLGVMMGWFIGSSDIHLNSGRVKKLFLSLASIVVVFIGMVSISQLEANIATTGLLGIFYSYALGLIFSILVTWIIPRFWKLFNLAH